MKYTEMTKREIVEYGTEVGVKLEMKLLKVQLIAQLKSYLSTLEAKESPLAKIEEVEILEGIALGESAALEGRTLSHDEVKTEEYAKISNPTTEAEKQHFKDMCRMLEAEREAINRMIRAGAPEVSIDAARERYEEVCKRYPM